jgi:hypothetical protein
MTRATIERSVGKMSKSPILGVVGVF